MYTNKSLSPAWNRATVDAAVTTPLLQQSIALQTANVIRPLKGQLVEIPLFDHGTDSQPGWTEEGAEPPVVNAGDAKQRTINHYKAAGQARISWEALKDSHYDITGFIGSGIVSKLLNTLDKTFLTTDPQPISDLQGIGNVEGVNALDGGKTPTDTNPIIDAIAHAESYGYAATSIIMSPVTRAALAKITQGSSSRVPLITTLGLGQDGQAPTPTGGPVGTLQGVPVYISMHVPENTIYVVPQQAVTISLRDDVTIDYNEQAHFSTMEAGIIGSVRVGYAVTAPQAITRITYAS